MAAICESEVGLPQNLGIITMREGVAQKTATPAMHSLLIWDYEKSHNLPHSL